MKKITILLLVMLLCVSFSFAAKRRHHNDRVYYGMSFNNYGAGTTVGYRYRGLGVGVNYSWPYYHNRHNRHYGWNVNYDPFYWNYNTYYDAHYQRERQQAGLQEIQRLEAKKKEAQRLQKEIRGVKVSRPKFYKKYTTNTRPVSMAEITVKNGSSHDIAKFYFKGMIKTHITDKTVINETFSYEPEESLEPGDEAVYNIPLNDFGSWAKAQIADEWIFTVTLEGIETYDGETIGKNAFSSADRKRLNKLKREYIY